MVPIVVFSLISGVVADALDRRRLMIVTQSAMMVLAAGLALLTFRGLDALWPLYVLSACASAASAFDGPARQALLPALVPREHLPNAISLNTMMLQVASVAGPSLAGIVIAWLGLGILVVNSVLGIAFHARERAAGLWLIASGGMLQLVLLAAAISAFSRA